MTSRLIKIVLDMLFPAVCFNCHTFLKSDEPSLCQNCFNLIPINPLSASNFHAAASFRHPLVKALIHELKFGSRADLAHPLSRLLIEYASSLDLSDYLVIPIPLSPKRLKIRGFNQAEAIARPFADHFHLPLLTALIRVHDTAPQAQKSFSARQTNLADCFAVKDSGVLTNKKIILLDDVSTTGATLKEAARALSNFPIKNILYLTAAH